MKQPMSQTVPGLWTHADVGPDGDSTDWQQLFIDVPPTGFSIAAFNKSPTKVRL